MGKQRAIRRERREKKQSDRASPDRSVDAEFGVQPGGAKIAMWGVGFLDLMGYQEELAKTDVFPLPGRGEALEMFRQVVNRRLAIADGPAALLASIGSVRLDADTLSPAEKQVANRLNSIRVATTGFSDSVFLYTPLDDIERKAPMFALSQLVVASTLSLFSHLMVGSPIRGGVDIAAGILVLNHLHSAATAKAVRLEKRADYPRILVGERFVEYIRQAAATPDDAPVEYIRHRELAKDLLSILYTDPSDAPGSPCGIDYLGATFQRLAPLRREHVLQVWDFANRSYNEFRERPDDDSRKVCRKYERLIEYIRTRSSIWGLPS